MQTPVFKLQIWPMGHLQGAFGNTGASVGGIGGFLGYQEGGKAREYLRESNKEQKAGEAANGFLYRQIALTIFALLLSYFGVWLWSGNGDVYRRWAGYWCSGGGLVLLIWTWSRWL